MVEPNSTGHKLAADLSREPAFSAAVKSARARSDRAVLQLARTGPVVVAGAAGFIGFQ